MTRPSKRSRNKKRFRTKTSGGRTVIHYRSKKTNVGCCSNCGQILAGLGPASKKTSKITGTQKRVGRMYSGNLCHSCLRSLLRQAARNL